MDVGLLQNLLNNIHAGIYVLDRDGNYIYCNQTFVKQTHYTEEEILKLNAYQVAEDGKIPYSAGVAVLKEKRIISAVNDVTTPKGFKYRQLVTASPIFDEKGEMAYALVEMARMDLLQKRYQSAVMMENQSYYALNVEQGWYTQQGENKESVVAESKVMKTLLQQLEYIARSEASILLTGETGVGKEVVAQYIHKHSQRAKQKLMVINCAAFPENLLEAELFGYEKGAFTGAASGKEGLIEKADGGTLFLDEINSMPLALQGKILRVLETHKCTRIGSVKEKYIDFRLLTATNQELKKCIGNGTFRSDLYYRIAVVPIEIPPLRERKEDIRPLTIYFLEQFCKKYGKNKVFAESAFVQLCNYDWPGNVRELKNVVERIYVSSVPESVEIERIPEKLLQNEQLFDEIFNPTAMEEKEVMETTGGGFQEYGYKGTYKEQYEQFDKEIIGAALREGKTTYGAAKILDLNQSTVAKKKKKYGL